MTTTPYGVWFDEAQNCLEAMKILDRPSYRPVFVPGLSQMPAMLFYYYAIFVELLGRNVFAVRLATTFIALGAVVAVWLLGRELFHPRVGIIAAAFLAMSRWHVDFSRFAIAQITTTLFIPLTLFFFVRSLRRSSPRDAVLAGVILGLGLQFYYSMITVPILLILFFVHRFVWGESRSLAAVGLVVLTLVSMTLSYAPVMQYAKRHKAQFSKRMRTVSVIKKSSAGEAIRFLAVPSPERDRVLKVLEKSAIQHARMFHLEGDRNGRHNYPGAPMFDPVTGFFLVVGFGWCLLLFWRPMYGLLLIWFGAMIAPGIFSLAFEAPQGARTLGLTAVVALMAALPLSQLSLALRRLRWRWPGRLLSVGLPALLLATGAVQNWRLYFEVQLYDSAVWASFSTAETKIARVVKKEGLDADIYVPSVYFNTPAQRLIAGDALRGRPFQRSKDLPLEWKGRKALVFFQGSKRETAKLLRQYYPRAELEPFGAPGRDGSQGAPILWIARIPASDIEALQGWVTVYQQEASDDVVEAVQVAEEATSETAWDWSGAPVPVPFTAQARGVLRVSRDGIYRLRLESDVPAKLEIDDETVLSWESKEPASALLARGSHTVKLTTRVAEAMGKTRLLWRPPNRAKMEPIPPTALYSPSLPTGGLIGQYFRNKTWAGRPAFQQIDPQVAFYFHLLPLPRPFSIRWVGSLFAPRSGRYSLGTSAIDGSQVLVDGKLVVNNDHSNRYAQGSCLLEKGWHEIEVKYWNNTNFSQVYLYWIPPGGRRAIIPSEVLRPPGPGGELLELGEEPVSPELLRQAEQAGKRIAVPDLPKTDEADFQGELLRPKWRGDWGMSSR